MSTPSGFRSLAPFLWIFDSMSAAHSGGAHTVKKVRNRQNRFAIQWIFTLWISFTKAGDSKLYSLKTSLLRKDFDLLRNSRPTVPMYADERELLVFRTFSQSVSVPKKVFDSLTPQAKRPAASDCQKTTQPPLFLL